MIRHHTIHHKGAAHRSPFLFTTLLIGHDASHSTLLPGRQYARIREVYYVMSYLPSLFKTLHMSLCCLEGSTMSNLVHRRMRCARTDLHSILCLEGSTPEDVRCIYVYRLAIDARPKRGDGVAGRKWPSLLGDFQTGIASMTRKRHLASTARGFYCFCLMALTGPVSVPSVQSVQSVLE